MPLGAEYSHYTTQGFWGVAATGEKDSSDGLDLAKGTVR